MTETEHAPSVIAPERTDRLQLAVVAIASFVVWSGYGAILPYLPVFLREQAHASMWLLGLVAAGFAIGTFVFSAPLGRLSDIIGRKPVLVSGVFLYAIASFLFLTTTHPGWFVLFRLLEGMGSAAVGPAGQAFLADITPEHERSQAYGWLTSAQFGGLVAGPALAVPIYSLAGGGGTRAFHAIFLFGAILSTLAAVALTVTIKEPAVRQQARRRRGPRAPILSLLRGPILAFVIVAFTGHYAMGAFEVIWSIYLRDVGASMTLISMTWIAFAVPMLFSWLGGRIADRHNRYRLMVSGYLFSAVAWVLYGTIPSLLLFVVVNVLEGVAIAYSYPAKQAFLIQVSPKQWIGTVTGMETTAIQLATLLGSLTAPLLYDVIGGLTLAVGGVLAGIGLLVAMPTLARAWDEVSASGQRMRFDEAEVLALEEDYTAISSGPGDLGQRPSV